MMSHAGSRNMHNRARNQNSGYIYIYICVYIYKPVIGVIIQRKQDPNHYIVKDKMTYSVRFEGCGTRLEVMLRKMLVSEGLDKIQIRIGRCTMHYELCMV